MAVNGFVGEKSGEENKSGGCKSDPRDGHWRFKVAEEIQKWEDLDLSLEE